MTPSHNKPVLSFACTKCGKPLGKGRARQGMSLHPSCRLAPTRNEIDAAIDQAEQVLRRMRLTPEEGESELSAMFAAAATQARQVVRDLKTLRGALGQRN